MWHGVASETGRLVQQAWLRRAAAGTVTICLMAACGGLVSSEPIDAGVTLVDVRFDALGPLDFTAPVPWPTPDASIPLPIVEIDSSRGQPFYFVTRVFVAQKCESMLMRPERAARYVGFGTTPGSGGTLEWTVLPRRIVGASARAATMQVAVACGGKVSNPVTVPIPFY